MVRSRQRVGRKKALTRSPSAAMEEPTGLSTPTKPLGKLNHASTPSITKYFTCDKKTDIKEQEGKINEYIISPSSNINKSTTPHRIQFCYETVRPVISPLRINFVAAALASKKAAKNNRNRLNPSQTSNRQAPISKSITKPIISEPKINNNTEKKLTDYFPVRRSVRKTKNTVLEERQRDLEDAILAEKEDGLEVTTFEGKGRGVITTRHFCRGEFVVEYAGELVDLAEARIREGLYAQDQNKGCYMYYFKHKGQQYCIDATAESGRLGRLVNHSRFGNLLTKTVMVKNKPHLILVARNDIPEGQEVLYDYGDRSKESLMHHPWLNA